MSLSWVEYLIALLWSIFVSINQEKVIAPTTTPTPVVNVHQAVVTKIIDGDTVWVSQNGQVYKIRLIGVDTPEVVDPRRPVQCFGREASAKTKQLLQDKTVTLKSDPTQADTDKYGRLLRYVYLDDGTLINQIIISQGYGHEYTYQVPYQLQSDFKNSEDFARKNQLGLWAPGACAK